jgi:hypothetical protein
MAGVRRLRAPRRYTWQWIRDDPAGGGQPRAPRPQSGAWALVAAVTVTWGGRSLV